MIISRLELLFFRSVNIVILLFVAIGAVFPIFTIHSTAQNPFGITSSVPYTAQIGGCPYLDNQMPTVFVNVSATALNLSSTSLNVSLYYKDIPTSSPFNFTTDFSKFNHTDMVLVRPFNDSHLIYSTTLPKLPNNSTVWGEAIISGPNRTEYRGPANGIYSLLTPPKNQTLQLSIKISDVEPGFTNLNLTTGGTLYNTASFNSIDISSNSYPGFPRLTVIQNCNEYFSTPNDKTQFVQLFYTSGDPNLFPFDSYEYNLQLTPFTIGSPLTNLSVNGFPIKPNYPYSNLIPNSTYNFNQTRDISHWNIFTTLEYRVSNSSTNGVLNVDFRVTDVASGNLFVILTAIFSMYALLGSSILLTSKKDMNNRLIIYLTIFIFSTGIVFGTGALPPGPSVVGLTMLQRLTFALIPTTALLSVWSIFRILLRKSTASSPRQKSILRIGDTLAGLAVLLVAYSLTSFSGIQNYTFDPNTGGFRAVTTTYNLLDFKDLSYWGPSIVLVLSIGFVYGFALLIWNNRSGRFQISRSIGRRIASRRRRRVVLPGSNIGH